MKVAELGPVQGELGSEPRDTSSAALGGAWREGVQFGSPEPN